MDEKRNFHKFSEKFSTILKKFIKKLRKLNYFRRFFTKFKIDIAVMFCAFGRKEHIIGNFEKRKVSKILKKFL